MIDMRELETSSKQMACRKEIRQRLYKQIKNHPLKINDDPIKRLHLQSIGHFPPQSELNIVPKCFGSESSVRKMFRLQLWTQGS